MVRIPLLSSRQSEIAELVAAGKSSREIAEALVLSPRTVETHVGAIYNKLGIRSRVELVAALFEAGRPATAVASEALPELPGYLPLKLTSFVGRSADIAAIAELLSANRIVTIIGMGGVGKTRAALQVAETVRHAYPDGAWFVELAQLALGEYVPAVVAQSVGLALPSNGDPLDGLLRQLRWKRALLVFDDCERVVDAAAHTAATILRDCPYVTIVATSRQALRTAGEASYRLASLELPEARESRLLRAADSGRYPALELFAARACAVDDRFAITDENVEAVAEICRRLDGLPLAIELAAARTKILSPQQLLVRLSDRLRLLSDGDRTANPRHQTLRALIDWSYDLLTAQERQLLRHLSIFVNGFTLEGAIAVGAMSARSDADVLDTVATLIDKSLVMVESAQDALRYRLLESTRVYAAEKLSEAGERDVATERHLHYLRDRFQTLRNRAEHSGRGTEFKRAFEIELGDVRAALDAAPPAGHVRAGAELLAELAAHWVALGLGREGRLRNERYLELLPDGTPALAARLSSALAFMLIRAGRKVRALEVAAGAVASARAGDAIPVLAEALRVYATAALSLTKLDDAEAAIDEAEALPGASLHQQLTLSRVRAWLTMYRDPDAASPLYERLVREYRAIGDKAGELITASNYAVNEFMRGLPHRAIAISNDFLPARRATADQWSLAFGLSNLGGYLCAAGDAAGAEAAANEAVALFAAIEPDSPNVAMAIEVVALARALRGDLERAAILEAFADAAFARHGFERELNTVVVFDRLQALLAAMPDAELARARAYGAALSGEAVVALVDTIVRAR